MRLAIGAALLLLAGCDTREAALNEAANAVDATANQIDAMANAANAASDELANIGAPAAAVADLSGYAGKHPREKVAGISFLDHSAVKAAVAKLPDAAVRDFVFGYNGPDAPIASKDGRLIAWGCEIHNCGYHNWAVSITPDGATADICLYDNDDDVDGSATWYLADGRRETRAGSCPSE